MAMTVMVTPVSSSLIPAGSLGFGSTGSASVELESGPVRGCVYIQIYIYIYVEGSFTYNVTSRLLFQTLYTLNPKPPMGDASVGCVL